MSFPCPVKECSKERPAEWHLVCKPHWMQTPKPLRDQLWHEYRKEPLSRDHIVAIREVLKYLNGAND